MAQRPLHKCNAAGCNLLVRTPRCEKHTKEQASQPEARDNSYRRGYDKRWARVRRLKLSYDPLCEDCKPRVVAATEVHHVLKVSTHPEQRLDMDNLMSLCKSCHARRTARGE